MRIHIERQGRGEEQTMGRILGRILAVVTPAVLFCFLLTWSVAAQVDTTTTVAFPTGSFVVGQSVTVTWTVDAQTDSFTFAGGTLERSLWDPDGTSLNPGDVTSVSGSDPFTSTYAFTANKAGVYTAGGNYTGCPTCTPVVNGSSATDKTLTVSKRSTSTAVTGPTTAVVNQPLTFTVEVTDGAGVGTAPSLAGNVTWTVTLPDTSTATLNGTVNSDGDGTISYSPPVTGSYTIEAAYQGNASYEASASSPATSFSVSERATSLAVTGASAAVVAEPVEVTATVSDNSGKANSPAFSGTVTWSHDGTGTLNSTSCTVSPAGECSVIYTPASGDIGNTVTITARYDNDNEDGNDNDDPNYGISTGTHDVTTVSKRGTSAAVPVPPGTLYVNEPLTFEVQVSDDQVGTGTSPSLAGNVTWTVTYTPTDTGTLVEVTSSGETVDVNGYGEYIFTPPYASSELTAGYAITAEYAGNTYYTGSSDGPEDFTVSKRTATAAVTVPTGKLYVNEPLTFEVQVSDDQVGTGTSPSLAGDVTWTVTYTPTDTGTLVEVTSSGATVNASGYGVYSFTPPTDYPSSELNVGYEIKVVYAGNDDYDGSTSATEAFTVDERPTLMSVTAGSAYVNEEVTVTATVSDASGASGSPDFVGTVRWAHSGSGSICPSPPCTCTVDTGGACSVTYTPAAADAGTTVTVTARYDTDGVDTNGNDDPNYGISEDSDNIPVSKRPTKTQDLTMTLDGTYVDETWNFEVDVIDTSGVGDTPPSFDAGATVTWTVTLPDSSTTALPGAATSNGVNCTISYDHPTMVGDYTIEANYEGNDNYAEGDPDASLGFTVSAWPTSSAIDLPQPPPTLYVQKPFDFDVSVTDSTNPGSPSYSLEGSVVATITFNAGFGPETATVTGTVNNLGIGTLSYTPPYATDDLTTNYQVTVQYLGNDNYAESTSDPEPFTVVKWPTTVTVAPDPALRGGGSPWLYKYEPWQFVVTVTCDSPPGPPPFTPDFSGNVDWSSVAMEYSFSPSTEGTVDASGNGDVMFAGWLPGSGNVLAEYDGNAVFAQGTGVYIPSSVFLLEERETTTTITGPQVSGVTHTFTVVVKDASDAAGTPPDPTGTVDWTATGATPASDSLTLSEGRGTFTVTPPSGTYTVGADYQGNDDNYYLGSTASSLTVESGARATSTTITGPGDPVCLCQAVQLTATVLDESGVTDPPPPDFAGTVTWTTSGSGTFATSPCTVSQGGQCSVYYTPAPSDLGTVSVSASYSGDDNYDGSGSSAFVLTVIKRATRTDVTAQPGTVYVNETTSLSATVTDLATDCCGACETLPDPKDVTFSRKSGSPGTGTVSNSDTVDTYTPTAANTDHETHFIVGEYSDTTSGIYLDSAGEIGIDVKKRDVAVTLTCDAESVFLGEYTAVTVRVTDATPLGHGGSMTLAGGSLVLQDAGRNGAFDTSATGSFTTDPLVKSWSSAAESWDGSRRYYEFTVYYKPAAGDAGTSTLAATYQGSSVYEMQLGGTTLGVEARPTTVSIVCETDPVFVDQRTKCTITVQDVGPTASSTVPTGAIHLTTSGDGHFYATDSSTTAITDKLLVAADGGSVDVYYEAETANAAQDTHILSANYIGSGDPPDATTQIHADSSGNVALTVKLRKTTTVVSVSPASLPYRTSMSSPEVTVTVQDVSPGDKSSPGGKLMLEAPGGGGRFNSAYTSPPYNAITGNWTKLLTLTWNSFNSALDGLTEKAYYYIDKKTVPIHPILAVFEPTDGKHLASADAKQFEVTVDADSYPDPPDPSTAPAGTGEVISCGLIGATTLDEIFNFSNSLLAYIDIMWAMDLGATIIQLLPDVLIDATDPAWSVIHAIFQGTTVDLDGDGIPGLFELGYVWAGLYDFNPDVDGDGIWDKDEIALAGGQFYPTLLDRDFSWSRPNPTHPDSDRDGISDGDEYYTFLTNCCDPDSDDDGLTDGQELASGLAFDATGYESATLPDPSPRPDVRDHADPWVQDTDGDGLNDALEFEPGSLSPTYSTFVNDPDSDGDGLLDGVEDSDFSGSTSYTLGGSNSEGSGETHPCIADTDGDGLTDGEEEGLFGRGPQTVVTPTGTVTVPALDDDMDNDGLSDYEEQIVTGTDPLNWDTDGDGIGDAQELIVISGAFPTRSFDQESNPLDKDTDHDGLLDNIEYSGTGVTRDSTSSSNPGTRDQDCPYVSNADSDNDGLEDGYEVGSDGVWEVTRYGDSTQDGIGETSACKPDTDNDGLLDGEEEGLFGQGSVSVVYRGGGTSSTVPALDTDCDRDGMSDYEEVHVTMTNPLHWDTDGDTISDADELIATSAGTFPVFSADTNTPGVARTFYQESDPLDPDTDDDLLPDNKEYDGTRLGDPTSTYWLTEGGDPDTVCPFVNDDDSDDDGLQDGIEDANRNGKWDPVSKAKSDSQITEGETNLCDPDTDDDGLTDGEEVGLFGGLPVKTTSPHYLQVVSTTAGNTIPALDDDSDNDGLSDYEEVNITETDALDADTDDDNITDADELISTGGSWPKRTFDQESDPLDIDTDDDGLTDDIEWDGSGLGITREPGGTRDLDCPYVNDDDSDDDGLQDGVEDANHDGVWGDKLQGGGITVGSFSSQASKTVTYWETDLCNPDTDGDGLLDGEEVSLIGGGPVLGRPAAWPANQPPPGFNTVTPEGVSTTEPILGDVTSPSVSPAPPATRNDHLGPYTFAPVLPSPDVAVTTIPALDSDSDNDGLSDYEEVNITSTDPLDQDTDNDTLMDSEELIATGGAWPQRTFDQESDPLDINTDDDHLFDPQEYAGSGLGTSYIGTVAGDRDTQCPFVNDDDSDDDGIQDGKAVYVNPGLTITGSGAPYDYSYTHYEDFLDIDGSTLDFPGEAKANVGDFDGEQRDDALLNVCDPDSDGDGLNDGEEVAIGTNPDDCDTDDDGRNDWHEHTGGGPIPTDPFDPDTDDDGLLDSAEVFGSNPTNPVNADTDGDGLCDGGTRTPWMKTVGDPRVIVNPICKSCSTPGVTPCISPYTRGGSPDGIGDHPNPLGIGEDEDGWGDWDIGIETDPNQYDTDGDAVADGIERLAFSSTRQYLIPTVDIFGRPITVTYPAANNVQDPCGCMDPLDPDSDDDGLSDGYEDRNHDGNFDFLPSEFDHQDPLPGPPIPYPTETNPCDPDTDHDELTDWEERHQRQPLATYPALPPSTAIDNDGDGLLDEDPIDGIDNDGDGSVDEDPPEAPIELTFNPTNPLDHDTDNDRIYDGPEVKWVCTEITYSQLDNDGDALIDEDPVDGIDNDLDGLIDEDDVDFFVRFVPMLDPTNRDSDSDGFIDGLDADPCNSDLIPIFLPAIGAPVDSDGDGFEDEDEEIAGTHPLDPDDYPTAYVLDLDFDTEIDDRLWLEPTACCGIANSVAIDIDCNVLLDARVQIVKQRHAQLGDFDEDGFEDDCRYVIEYAFANYRVLQPRIVATIDDFDCDLVIDWVVVEKK